MRGRAGFRLCGTGGMQGGLNCVFKTNPGAGCGGICDFMWV